MGMMIDQLQRVAPSANVPSDAGTKKPDRFRIVHKFWLDVTNPMDDTIDECIHRLKAQRMFTDTVRQGIQLIDSLRRGRVDVLERLFPFVRAHYAEQFTAGQGDLAARLAKLEAMLKTAPAAQPALHPVAAPDDDGLLVVTKAKSDGKSAERFLSSAFKLVQ